jgi:hypothetical protein
MILKDSVSVNGVETKLNLDEGLIGYFPVFGTYGEAMKWIRPFPPETEIVELSVRGQIPFEVDKREKCR